MNLEKLITEAKMAPAVADLKAMTDAFEGIDKLAEGAPRTDGAPNFRRVISYLHITISQS